MTSSYIDLRSDTVTKPDEEMRKAMADAEVGDDVLDHDPTMAALEEEVAHTLGFPAALWVPSGSMGNLIALMLHLRRGDQFLAPEHSHVLGSELGTAAWLAQGMPMALPHDGGPGRPSPETVVKAAGSPGPYFTLNTTLLCLENTHNFGAPVGSILAASPELITEARRIRKMLGGGVRQGGVLAAAGIVALRSQARLSDDHDNAQRLAAGLRERGWAVDEPATNIVLAATADPSATVAQLAAVDVGAVTVAGKVRFVTHRDVSTADIDEVLSRLAA
jgi:threonine aldolase